MNVPGFPDISVFDKAAGKLLKQIIERIRLFDSQPWEVRCKRFADIKAEVEDIVESYLEVIRPYSRGGAKLAFLVGEPTILVVRVWPLFCLEECGKAADALQEICREHGFQV